MAYPTFTSAISTQSSDTTTHNWTLPSGNAAGKLLVLFIMVDGITVTINTPTGFTRHSTATFDTGGGGGASQGALFYKITTGSESSSSITTTGSEKSVTISVLVTGSDNAEPQFATIGFSTSSTPNPPNLTVSGGSDTILWMCGAVTSAAENATTWSIPSSYTVVQRGNSNTVDSTDVQFALCYREVTAASENPGTFTIGASNAHTAFTLAFVPGAPAYDPGALNPIVDSQDYYSDFIGNFGISSSFFNHQNVLNLFSSLRPSGNILQNDTSIPAASDTGYLKLKVLSPNSGNIYERISFKPTQLPTTFAHLASGLTLNMRYDSITTNSGIMEVWLDASGKGYTNNNQSWWYSGPISLPSGQDQLLSVSKHSNYAATRELIDEFGNITIHVKYPNSGGSTHNELNIYSMSLCGEQAFIPTQLVALTTLHTIGGAAESGYITLYTSGNLPTSGNIPLYTYGFGPTSGNIPLYIVNATPESGNITLFTRGGISQDMILFVKQDDPLSYSGYLDLVTFGSTTGSGYLFSNSKLFIEGNNIPSGALPLYIGGYQDPLDATSNMNLFLRAPGEYNTSGEVVQVVTNFTPLTVYNIAESSGLSLYLEAQDSLSISGAMNLVMWRQYESLYNTVPMMLLGPSGLTEVMPLYLQGMPNDRGSITLILSGVADINNTLSTYVHGF